MAPKDISVAIIRRIIPIAMALMIPLVSSALEQESLRRALDRPLRPQTIFLSVGPTLGAVPGFANYRPGFSGSVIFHPSSASDFTPSLFAWNTGMILQGDYRIIDPGRSLLSASYLLRKYINDMRFRPPRISPFLGAGAGVALAVYPIRRSVENQSGSTAIRTVDGQDYYFSFISEFGYEIAISPVIMVTVKAQWQNFIHRNIDYSNWTMHLQVGIPLPW